jgi:hypothetical protein
MKFHFKLIIVDREDTSLVSDNGSIGRAHFLERKPLYPVISPHGDSSFRSVASTAPIHKRGYRVTHPDVEIIAPKAGDKPYDQRNASRIFHSEQY